MHPFFLESESATVLGSWTQEFSNGDGGALFLETRRPVLYPKKIDFFKNRGARPLHHPCPVLSYSVPRVYKGLFSFYTPQPPPYPLPLPMSAMLTLPPDVQVAGSVAPSAACSYQRSKTPPEVGAGVCCLATGPGEGVGTESNGCFKCDVL